MEKMNSEKIRVLLVDDEEGFRSAIARRLGKRGIFPMQAGSGEECLEILGVEPVDVVVLDVKMPGIGGIETLKIIRTSHANVQVILLTGNVAVSDGVEGIKSGAFDYLTKPVEIDHLHTKIMQAFDIRKLQQEQEKEREYRAKLEKKWLKQSALWPLEPCPPVLHMK
ncbi:Response regulator receiver sensor signal transduction histidine kinase (fragment) [Desulfamplus magnetovallimortis]|uniref:Response regulator receiver sensor signal transduction histidine kinase n=1 Tax=Desulfamplus magnetovallimortis TaxID=1246637 RepID=A0A1W1HJ51_9BACT